MRFPGGKKKALTLSYDDGVEQDIRLLSVMNQNDLKGTFNLNSGLYAEEGCLYPPGTIHRRLSRERALEVFGNSGMEIAVHGLRHKDLEQLPSNLCLDEVMEDRRNLEREFGRLVRGMAYAYGAYSGQVVDCLRHSGIAYARTVMATGDFRLPSDWYRLSATCHHRDERLMDLAEMFVEKTPNRTSWLFYLWGHSYEFEADNNWERIETFAAYVGKREDIWYATNIEIHDYIEAYRNLQFSMDGTMVYNPGILPVYFEKGDMIFCAGAGETAIMN